jgi:hypothetical protein
MKLLKEKYKTYDGAQKRCGFENGVAKSEFEQGYKSRHYHYTVQTDTDGHWRVARQERAKAS